MFAAEQFAMTCESSGTHHRVSVARPPRYDHLAARAAAGDSDGLPLIFCLDAPWVFGTVVDATRIMSMAGEAPEAIVVGLGFDTTSMSDYLRQRARWFSPTPWVPPPETGVKDVAADECGRAMELLQFVQGQLLPRIALDHPIGERWFLGHSFSALFGLAALFEDPSAFDRWMLLSPSIWWDDCAIFETERAYADTHDDLPAALFVSAGTEEQLSPFDMAANAMLLTDRLRSRSYPTARITSALIADQTHASTIGAAVAQGLRSLHQVDGPAS